MPPPDLATLTALIASGTGLIGFGIGWGSAKRTLTTLTDSHRGLKEDYISHKENRDIHIDPRRDEKSEAARREDIDKHFREIKESLDKLNARCEARGKDCGGHFTNIERSLAADGK